MKEQDPDHYECPVPLISNYQARLLTFDRLLDKEKYLPVPSENKLKRISSQK